MSYKNIDHDGYRSKKALFPKGIYSSSTCTLGTAEIKFKIVEIDPAQTRKYYSTEYVGQVQILIKVMTFSLVSGERGVQYRFAPLCGERLLLLRGP